MSKVWRTRHNSRREGSLQRMRWHTPPTLSAWRVAQRQDHRKCDGNVNRRGTRILRQSRIITSWDGDCSHPARRSSEQTSVSRWCGVALPHIRPSGTDTFRRWSPEDQDSHILWELKPDERWIPNCGSKPREEMIPTQNSKFLAKIQVSSWWEQKDTCKISINRIARD